MENAGSALMGIGRGSGENRAVEAAKAAIDSPLLEVSIDGAKGILFTVTGGPNLGMYEVNEAARIITGTADPNARVIFGTVIDENMKDEVKITVIATGFGDQRKAKRVGAVAATPERRIEPTPPPRKPTPQPSMPIVRPKPVEQTKSKEEEELEIPAFIRKKMM